jgi:hypothetical protein
MAGKIFISYKRDDDPGMAGRLADALKDIYSGKQVFYDTEDIPPGVKFQEYIESNIIDSSVLLVVIGAKWLELHKKPGEKDFVIFEVTTAQKYNVPIIPVLLQNTPIPPADQLAAELKFLPDIQTFTIRHVSFNADVKLLSKSIDVYRKKKRKPAPVRLKALGIGLACLVIITAFFWWIKQKPKGDDGYRKVVRLTSQQQAVVIELSSFYVALLEADHPACIPLGTNTILTISPNDSTNLNFYYGTKEQIPESLNLQISGDRLYVNQELKGLSIDNHQPLDTLTNDQIRNLETICLMKEAISKDWYNQLTRYVQINPRISIIPDYVMDKEDNDSAKIGDQAYRLMQFTTPDILVCCTSFPELGVLNLGSVKSVFVKGGPGTASNFYRQLALPRLKNIVSEGAEAAKIAFGDSVESISIFNDTTLNDFSLIKNKGKIRQLQLIDNTEKERPPESLDFNKLATFKNLKSFGYYNIDNHTSRSFAVNFASLHDVMDLTISNVKIADLPKIAEQNPGLQNLTLMPVDTITNMDWAGNFTHLKSLSLYVDSISVFAKPANSAALSKLNELRYLGVTSKAYQPIDRTSKEYQNLISACPSCNIYVWGICLGSGWLLLFFPVIGAFLVFKALSRKNQPE